MPAIRLRPANQDDIDLLLRYRNDTQTRAASRNQEPVDKHEHSQWLSQTLMRKDRRLIIGEIDGLPVGTARLDIREDQSIEVSWTVAPEMRGQGIGHQL
ncbi:MAG: GNAT family N-acetyltransferase, partial [Pirellulaceae bacterium]|nr:GNAT family N-acetyltransferase [Pirellulaceae bacterium]